MANPKDLVVVGPVLDDGGHACVRYRDGAVSVGSLRPVKDGQPCLGGALVRLKGSGPVYEVEALHDGPEGRSTDGPAQVNSQAFLTGWDRIFGGQQAVGQA